MDRIERIRSHLNAASPPSAPPPPAGVFLAPREASLAVDVYVAVLTPAAVAFVSQVAARFAGDVAAMYADRKARRLLAESDPAAAFPKFLDATRSVREDATWRIDPLPKALSDRRVDIGDIAPCEKKLFFAALNSGAQGVQVDFDDGNCPTWKNTLEGHFHLMDAARGQLTCDGRKLVETPALLIVRPRAWNMDETNMMVGGRVVPGAIFDFAMHLFHNGKLLFEQGRGPFVYLSKLEGYKEAALWRRIFDFTEQTLGLPSGSIKATVLIENIYAAFEMDEILYALRHHSAGLNCGMWDYTASIVVNFRAHAKCVLPDRQRFVSMRSPFLQHYMELLIQTCKKRGAPATTGMVPFVLDQLPPSLTRGAAIAKAKDAKRFEATAGSDGALVYDLALVTPIQEVFSSTRSSNAPPPRVDEQFYERILMTLPEGDVTLESVRLNLTVSLSYVLAWFQGDGTVVVNGCVEDSATAEISRAQLWQWIHHSVPLQGSSSIVTAALIHEMLLESARDLLAKPASPASAVPSMRHVVAALNLVFRVVTARSPPPFMTTFLLEQEPLTKSLEE